MTRCRGRGRTSRRSAAGPRAGCRCRGRRPRLVACPSTALARTSTGVPAGEYLTALSIRFVSTWRSRSGSPRTPGRSGGTSEVIRTESRASPARRDRLGDQAGEIELGEGVAERPRLDPRAVEHLADERGQAVGLVGDQGQKGVALLGGELAPALLQRPGRPDHGRHRRPHLVRDERDEVGAQRGEAAQLGHRPLLDLVQPLGLVGPRLGPGGLDREAAARASRRSAPSSPRSRSGRRRASSCRRCGAGRRAASRRGRGSAPRSARRRCRRRSRSGRRPPRGRCRGSAGPAGRTRTRRRGRRR